MRPYFTRERFGRPQFLAGFLLLVFLGQAVWLVHSELQANGEPELSETIRLREGWKQWHGHGVAGAPFLEGTPDPAYADFQDEYTGFDSEHSPLLSLASAAPLLVWPEHLKGNQARYWRWLPRLPFLACGVFLGASLWYVARRLCSNAGGFIAMALYCFSPAMIQASAVWHTDPEIPAAWGAFGAVFTAIAVAHTLYAPREVVLWNWRRIVLLAISLAIAVGSQFSMIVLVPVALAFLLYVAPVRRGAGVVIWIAACALSALLLFGFYSFHWRAFSAGMQHAAFWGATWRGFAIIGVYKQMALHIVRACPALAVALPVACVVYALWPRTRYFGNTAPLLMAALFLFLGMAHPHLGGAGFLISAIPFLFVFVSGVMADLMETRYRALATACVLALLATYIVRTLVDLAQVSQG